METSTEIQTTQTVGTLINTDGGLIIIGSQPYSEIKPKRFWKKSIRFFGHLYITFSNCRVKKRQLHRLRSQKLKDDMRDMKVHKYKKQCGKCPNCGQSFEMNVMEMHHILPWARFPELRAKNANIILLCSDCHKEIHLNPWKNIAMMKAKADEFGIDLNERYDTKQQMI